MFKKIKSSVIEINENTIKEDKLENIFENNKAKNILIVHNIGFVKNELLALPDLDSKYIDVFIEKERHKRSKDNKLVSSNRLIDKYILLSTIEASYVEKYIKLSNNNIKTIKTRMDIYLDKYIRDRNSNFILVDIVDNSAEVFLSYRKEMKLLTIENDIGEDIYSLFISIRNKLSPILDIQTLDKIYINKNYEKYIDEIISEETRVVVMDNLENILIERPKSKKEKGFKDTYKKKSLYNKILNLENLLIVVLIVFFILNISRFIKDRDIYSKKNKDILSLEIENNKDRLKELMSIGTINNMDYKLDVKYILSRVPEDLYIEKVFLEGNTQIIDGVSKKRESILLFYKKLNSKSDIYELNYLVEDEFHNSFKFSIENKLEGDTYEGD